MDDRRAELVRLQRDARTAIRRGGGLVAFVPVVLGAATWCVLSLGPILGAVTGVFAMLYTFVGGLAGIFMFGEGVSDLRRSRRALAVLAERHQLPEARVVKS